MSVAPKNSHTTNTAEVVRLAPRAAAHAVVTYKDVLS